MGRRTHGCPLLLEPALNPARQGTFRQAEVTGERAPDGWRPGTPGAHPREGPRLRRSPRAGGSGSPVRCDRQFPQPPGHPASGCAPHSAPGRERRCPHWADFAETKCRGCGSHGPSPGVGAPRTAGPPGCLRPPVLPRPPVQRQPLAGRETTEMPTDRRRVNGCATPHTRVSRTVGCYPVRTSRRRKGQVPCDSTRRRDPGGPSGVAGAGAEGGGSCLTGTEPQCGVTDKLRRERMMVRPPPSAALGPRAEGPRDWRRSPCGAVRV